MLRKRRCETCSSWSKVDWSGGDGNFGSCAAIGDVNNVYGSQETPEDDCAYSFDFESYASGNYTGKNFGCIHWAEK